MPKPIVVVGSINLDLVVKATRIPRAGETIIGSEFRTFYGGKGANQAVAAARLGHPVFMVGNVGDDAFGAQLRAGLNGAGVDTTYVSTVPASSGVALITIGEEGQNNIVVVPGANDLLTPEQLEKCAPLLREAGFVLAQLEIPLDTVEALAELAENENVPLMLDPAPARELLPDLLRRVTWITPNETEAQILLKRSIEEDSEALEALDGLLSLGPKNAVLKIGQRGCVLCESHTKKKVPAFAVNAVDSTAAGDAFNAAFAVALAGGKPPYESAVFASATAAISVTRPGAQPSMPTLQEVQSFLAARM